jgi:NADP-dependent 3-hydroxy acid dehydrogenase YdfG
MNLSASIAWVTGASSGIGLATAKAFLDAGAVVVATSRSQERLQRAFDGVSEPRLCLHVCDVASASDVAATHERILREIGPVDILVNNAGLTVFRPFLSSSLEDFDRLHAVNLRGPFLCTQAVLPGMVERGRGAIVMIASVAARQVFSDSAVYSATKAGLKAMADCLRLEVRKAGVRVTTVFPGATQTDIWPARVLEKHGDKMMRSEDVATAIVHACASPDSVVYEDIVMQPVGGPL